MKKENKEQEYYRFEFKDYTTCFSEIEQSWVDFYDVPGDMTIKELHDIVGDSCLHKIKLGFNNAKEIMESKEYIKPKRIPTKKDEYGDVGDWTVVLPNGDKITKEYDDDYYKIIDDTRDEFIPFFAITKHNGEILKPVIKKTKKRNTSSKIDEHKNIKNILDYPPEIINEVLGVQSLEAPIGQIYTLKFPKIKKDNIFKRIWNKIKW